MSYIAKCHQALGDLKQEHRWYIRATVEDDTSRAPLVDVAILLLAQKAFNAVIDLCDRALELPITGSYIAERYANCEGPYDLMAVARHCLGQQVEAKALAMQAVELNPNDARLQANIRMIECKTTYANFVIETYYEMSICQPLL